MTLVDSLKWLLQRNNQPTSLAYTKEDPLCLRLKLLETSRSLVSFPLYYGSGRSIAPHQIKFGEDLVKKGGISLILIRREEFRNKKAWAITPAQAKYWYSKKWKGKSVKWSWIEKHGIKLERLKAPLRWNLQKVYDKMV